MQKKKSGGTVAQLTSHCQNGNMKGCFQKSTMFKFRSEEATLKEEK